MELHFAGADNKESQQKNKFYLRRKIFILNQSGGCQQPSGPVGRSAEWEKDAEEAFRECNFFSDSAPLFMMNLKENINMPRSGAQPPFARILYHYERAAREKDAQEHTDALYFYDKRKQHFKRQPRRRQSYVLENARHFASTVISTFPLIASCHLSPPNLPTAS